MQNLQEKLCNSLKPLQTGNRITAAYKPSCKTSLLLFHMQTSYLIPHRQYHKLVFYFWTLMWEVEDIQFEVSELCFQ